MDQQEFAQILKEKQTQWKEKTQKIKNDFKELLEEYTSLQTKNEEFEKQIQAMNSEKMELAESLDLTKVQFKDEASRFEDEKSLLLAEHNSKLKASATQLLDLMREMGVKIDISESDDSFSDF